MTNDGSTYEKISTLGFIGLGVMGEPMCGNLVTKTKLPVYGTDLKREPVERLAAKGLKACTLGRRGRAARPI